MVCIWVQPATTQDSPSSLVVHKLSLKLRMSDMPAAAALVSVQRAHTHAVHTLHWRQPSCKCASKQTQMAHKMCLSVGCKNTHRQAYLAKPSADANKSRLCWSTEIKQQEVSTLRVQTAETATLCHWELSNQIQYIAKWRSIKAYQLHFTFSRCMLMQPRQGKTRLMA